MSTITKTMKLYTSTWQGKKSFNLMPISLSCPFKEAIFDVDTKTLVFISKDAKPTFHMLPRLDDNGDPMKTGKGQRPNGKNYKEERKAIETSTEHYITEKEEVTEAIKDHAVNADSFDWVKYTTNIILPEASKLELVK